MVRKKTRLNASREGSMPFALVAVTILLLCTAYGVVTASMERDVENTESVAKDAMSASDAVRDTRRYIEYGIGNIINDISTDADGGNLVERSSAFREELDTWMEVNFPLTDRGVTVSLHDYDIGLTIENARLDGSEYRISFLKAKGTAEIEYRSMFSADRVTIDISADGTSGLPFVLESMTRFELSTGGSSSVLTELMTYQLTSVAQTRVMNGYGAISEYGDTGTVSILTEDDVMESFRQSLSIIETMCFRCNGENDELILNDRVDAAELMLENGLKIDLSVILSQAMNASADQMVVRWMDLFWGSEMLDVADSILDGMRGLERHLHGLFIDRNLNSSRPYIEDRMGERGITDYGTVQPGEVTVTLPAQDVALEDWYGFDDSKIPVKEMSVTVVTPGIDIMAWGGWDDFVLRYTMDRNDIREYMRNAIATASISSTEGYGAVTVPIDAFDDEGFLSVLERTFDTALKDGIQRTEDGISHSIELGRISDPMYNAMYDELRKNMREVYDPETFRNSVRDSVRASVGSELDGTGGQLKDALVESVTEQIMSSDEISSALRRTSEEFDAQMGLFRDVLTDVRKDNIDYVKIVLICSLRKLMEEPSVRGWMEDSARYYIRDLIENLRMNTKSDVLDISGGDSFDMTSGDGMRREFLDLKDDLSIDVRITDPRDNRDRCIHTVDLDGVCFSPYTSVFTVDVDAAVRYEVGSSDSVCRALGWFDSVSSSEVTIHTSLDIPCFSGWDLAGVEYTQSQHITDYIIEKLQEIFEPLIGPLEEIFALIKQLSEMCSTAIVEISAYAEKLVMAFYEAAEKPLALLQEYIENGLLGVLETTFQGFDIGMGYQSVTFAFAGMTVVVETRLATLKNSTKTLCKITMTDTFMDTDIKACIEIKHSEKNGLMIKGSGEMKGDDWKLKLSLDPMMKFSKKLLTVSGVIRDVGFSAEMPYILQYDVMEMKVSDIPGVGDVLSNIPIPVPGFKGAIDMGLFLKYDLPVSTDLVINEFDSNPTGNDRGNEWAELYNGSLRPIDLTGYTLVPGSDEGKSIDLEGRIPPLGRMVFTFPSQCLNNSKTQKGNGEMLTLYDADGNEVDSTPWKTDSYNDDRTWHRSSDGGSTWTFGPGSKDKGNGSIFGGNAIMKEFIIDSLKDAGDTAFYEMGNHLRSLDDIVAFLHRMVELFIKNLIEKIADIIIGAGVFISLELTDIAETQHMGMRVSLEMDSELVRDGLTWLLSQIPFMSEFISEPVCSDPLNIVCNDTYLRTVAYYEMSAPKFLNRTGEDIRVMMGISAAVNVSGMFTLFGKETGTWKAVIGVVIEDCPFELMPKKLKESNGTNGDLWLIRMTFSNASG